MIVAGEEWLPVVGYEGLYEVSDLGRVRQVRRGGRTGRPTKAKGGVLATFPATDGYPSLDLRMNGKRTKYSVHKLVAAAFLGPRPDGMSVRHLNGDVTDNRLVNLLYGTPSENTEDSVRHGTHRNARKTHCPKGHPLDVGNTILRRGTRECRECARAGVRAAYAKARARRREKQGVK